jgi:hypothetical protein
MPFDTSQVVALASAIGIVTNNDSGRASDVIKSPYGLVHANLARQANSGLFWRQIRDMKNVEGEPRSTVFLGPARCFFAGLPILGANFFAANGR